jgi:hypothetical protein
VRPRSKAGEDVPVGIRHRLATGVVARMPPGELVVELPLVEPPVFALPAFEPPVEPDPADPAGAPPAGAEGAEGAPGAGSGRDGGAGSDTPGSAGGAEPVSSDGRCEVLSRVLSGAGGAGSVEGADGAGRPAAWLAAAPVRARPPATVATAIHRAHPCDFVFVPMTAPPTMTVLSLGQRRRKREATPR